jgi:hypothetical protein
MANPQKSSKLKSYLKEDENVPEVIVPTLDSEEDTVMSSEVLEDVADLADGIYDMIFKIGAQNVPAEVVQKITQSHDLLTDAFESIEIKVEEVEAAAIPQDGTNGFNEEVEEPKQDDKKTNGRILQLARLGLIDRTAVSSVVRVVTALENGTTLTSVQRKIAFDLLTGLITVVTGDLVFSKAKQDLKKK